jgi:hypothetical protein
MLAWVVIDQTHSRQATLSFFPCSHSRFGSHPSLIPEKITPFFSRTYVQPFLQPVCFQIHPCNGDMPPFPPCLFTLLHRSIESQVTKSPVVHPLYAQQLTKCSSRNCFLLKTIHFDGGVWGTFRSRTFRRSNVQTLQRFLNLSPLFHTLGHSFALFCTPQKLNSFLFKRFRTLRQKTQPPRVGERGTNLTPCVSRTREIRPGQSGSLNAFNRTRDTGHIAQLSFRPETCWPCSDWGGLKST